MWTGKITAELIELFNKYAKQNGGTEPDEYDEIEFGETDEDYEEMLADVRECIKRKISLVELYGMEEG